MAVIASPIVIGGMTPVEPRIDRTRFLARMDERAFWQVSNYVTANQVEQQADLVRARLRALCNQFDYLDEKYETNLEERLKLGERIRDLRDWADYLRDYADGHPKGRRHRAPPSLE